jgi:hypothetical protein
MAEMSEVGRLLTAEDLAARWQVPASQIYRLTRAGRIHPSEVVDGRCNRCWGKRA